MSIKRRVEAVEHKTNYRDNNPKIRFLLPIDYLEDGTPVYEAYEGEEIIEIRM